jgi:hypothetical protein
MCPLSIPVARRLASMAVRPDEVVAREESQRYAIVATAVLAALLQTRVHSSPVSSHLIRGYSGTTGAEQRFGEASA